MNTPELKDTAHVTGQAIHSHAPSADEVVRVSCVRHRYEDGVEVALCGLDFIAKRGQRVAVLGPNGSGKTTMLYHILGLLRAEEGQVRVLGVDPAKEWPAIRRRVGVMLQNVDEQIIAPAVLDDVAFSARQYGLPEEEALERAREALDLFGIGHLADRVPHNLSGGEKRKVVMAGALTMQPELLVLDEPFEGLDPYSRRQMLDLLDSLAEAGVTSVLTTHDIDSVPEFADYCYVLRQGGEIALKGTPAEVFASPERIAASNIKPPVLADLFARLRELDASAPDTALCVEDAAEALAEWRSRTPD